MIKEISKKLTMKKTFFVTQLESFFNTISQEYQEIINEKEIENKILQEKINKFEIDIKNLVNIKDTLTKKSEIDKKQIESLQNELKMVKDTQGQEYSERLVKENIELKKRLEAKDDSQELNELKAKIKQLQSYISKGATAYNNNLVNQKSEDLIQEISQSLKR